MATAHPPQSLPSFAQTFGSPESLNRMPDMNNSLPPIQHRDSPFDRSRSGHASPQPHTLEHKYSKKRLHSETGGAENEDNTGSDGRRSPRTVRVKQESDADSLPPPKQGISSAQQKQHSPPSKPDSPNPAKKRRTLPIDTDVRRPSIDSGISPVVIGFSIPEDDPKAIEQVRSMIGLKQQQQALIEQRRGSTVGIMPPTAPPEVNVVNAVSSSESTSTKQAALTRGGRRSPVPPVGPANARRPIGLPPAAGLPAGMPSSARPASPPPAPQHSQAAAPVGRHPSDSPPTHTHLHPSASGSNPATHALPPPPISFARRRASRQLGKGKPADIVISPRTSSESHLQPYIQSAPPIPRGSQSQTSISGRPTMALPSLPPLPAPGQSIKRYSSGQVPPTPTRLGMTRQSVAGTTTAGVSRRSPPAASIPISSTLVPPTPASLHHPGYSGEKSAFLAPFEMFYDALSDSKQLKTWLSDQLQKSNALLAGLQRQQDQLEESVSAMVDKKVAGMREEMYGMRVRVEELETALRAARAQGYSPNMSAVKGKTKANGYQTASPVVPEAYTFPPIESGVRRPEPIRRVSSPTSENQSFPPSQNGSPVPFEVGRRLSVSAMRLDPPRAPPQLQGAPSHLPPRELPPHNFPPPHAAGGKGSWSPLGQKTSLPSVRSSLSHSTLSERAPLSRGGSGQGSGLGQGQGQSRMNPPEKRRASRSPDADEEARRERGAPTAAGEESGSSPQQTRARSPMEE
ncbi:hypothetical protein EIP86_006326 [Pleurotus ostreatoroseus]|nr:hypothetical protein EIP86_006326 [Pleurotus ostreatoroseus]